MGTGTGIGRSVGEAALGLPMPRGVCKRRVCVCASVAAALVPAGGSFSVHGRQGLAQPSTERGVGSVEG